MEATSTGAVALEGRLDGRCSAQVREALYDHMRGHPGRDVVVDLTRVESLDLTTVRLLAAAALQVERSGHRFVLRGTSSSVRRMLSFGGWRRFFAFERPAV